jgi:hypothetical protein
MKRQILQLGLVFGAAGAALIGSGCESLHHTVRPHSEDEKAEPGTAKPDDSTETKSFFRSGRISGAMSSEGREIERSLGIP